MRRWILFACGAVFLGAAAWHFGKPTPPSEPPTPAVVAVAASEGPKEAPAKIAEVIDLARAYEPVPDSEEVPPGGVDPASFIQVPDAPAKIPPAVDGENLYRNMIDHVQEAQTGRFSFGPGIEPPERIDIMPRSILDLYGDGSAPVRVSNIQFQGRVLPAVEKLDVMPREVK